MDEVLALPTDKTARIALRTQQLVAYESGVVDTVDPLAGSYFVESLTDAVEQAAWVYIDKIDGMGGAVAAIEQGYLQDEIEEAAYAYARAIDTGEKIIVGVNKFTTEEAEPAEVFPIDPALQQQQADRARRVNAERDQAAVQARLDDVAAAARGTQNLLYPMKEALRAKATLGEVSDVLRAEFGEYRPSR